MVNSAKVGGILSIVSGAFGFLYLAGVIFSVYMIRVLFNLSLRSVISG